MTRTQIILILALPIIFCLGVFLWQANPLFLLLPLGILGIIFFAFVLSAELTTFDAWDLLIRSILFRLGFKVNPPQSLDDDEHEHEHHHEAELSLNQILESLMKQTGAERGYIALMNQETGELEFQTGQGIEETSNLERGISEAVAKSREAILTSNANEDSRYASSSSIVGHSLRSVMAAPLIVDDKVIGVVYLDSRMKAGLFSPNQLKTLSEFTEENAQAIEKAARVAPLIPVPKSEEANIQPPKPSKSIEPEPVVDEETAFGGDNFDDDADDESEITVDIDEREEADKPAEIVDSKQEAPKPVSPVSTGEFAPPEPEEKPAAPIETYFTAYYPRQAAAKTEYGFYVYAHLQDALIESDVKAFSAELGGRVPKAVVAEEKVSLQEGALLTAMIHSEKLKFNQMGAMQVWKAPFVRFDFKFTADEALIDEIIEGRVAILLGLIEIASIDFKISVGAASPLAVVNALPEKPTLSLDASPSIPPYQKIFVSYSRQDSIVAEQYRSAQTMLGNTIFMDIHSIRAGEDWDAALKRFISEADVFQLFWSEASATSEHVRFEWEYALKQRCPDTLCRQFIRPTYWQKPMPKVPEELNHLHFAYVALESKTGDS